MTTTDVVISTVTGVLASYFVWWLTFKYLTPKIKFTDSISKLPTNENNSGFRYRFKFENCGSRNMIDVDVIVRLRIRGLRPNFGNNWEVIYLPTSSMEYQKLAIVRPIGKPLKGHKSLRPVFEIKPYLCEYFETNLFSKSIREKAVNQSLSLEDVLNEGIEANLQVLILGYDQYSGARKFFESRVFGLSDIQEGYYDRHSVFMVKTKKN